MFCQRVADLKRLSNQHIELVNYMRGLDGSLSEPNDNFENVEKIFDKASSLGLDEADVMLCHCIAISPS